MSRHTTHAYKRVEWIHAQDFLDAIAPYAERVSKENPRGQKGMLHHCYILNNVWLPASNPDRDMIYRLESRRKLRISVFMAESILSHVDLLGLMDSMPILEP